MEEETKIKNTGLRGITLADTKISYVDGENGRLIYRGYDINVLAKNSTFEETAYLLLYGDLPKKDDLASFDRKLKERRGLPKGIQNVMKEFDYKTHPMNVLQAVTSLLIPGDEQEQTDKTSIIKQSISMIAKFPNIITTWNHIRNSTKSISPNRALSHAANFLYMLNGEIPSSEMARTLDICLILHADHTFNASTFAAREVASTRAKLPASISAAIGALSGELHGGANVRVMETLHEIGSKERVEEYVRRKFNSHDRVMGMGHAIYRNYDPRALILEELIKGMGDSDLLDIATKVKQVTQAEFRKRKNREIYPNVDFYSGLVYNRMGFPTDLFTTIFAASRVAGWSAHIIEERFAEAQPKPVLYRPKAEYIGDYCGKLACKYEPIEKR
jgi:citrate synthase